MLKWIQIVFSLFTSLLEYLNTRKLMEAGAAKEREKNKEALDAIKAEQESNNIDNIDDAIDVLFPEASDSVNSLSKSNTASSETKE